jgi:hypothetical protein
MLCMIRAKLVKKKNETKSAKEKGTTANSKV